MFKLFKMKLTRGLPQYMALPFGGIMAVASGSRHMPDHAVEPTGRWKIKITEGKEPELYLECRDTYAGGHHLAWIYEGLLEVMEVPDPPKVTEYINECGS